MSYRIAPCTFADVKQFAGRAARERVSISDTGGTTWYGAFEGERIVACAALLVAGQKGRIKGCWTEVEYRGMGLGASLVGHLLKLAGDDPRLNQIEVLSVSPAFWCGLGFQPTREVRAGITHLSKRL